MKKAMRSRKELPARALRSKKKESDEIPKRVLPSKKKSFEKVREKPRRSERLELRLVRSDEEIKEILRRPPVRWEEVPRAERKFDKLHALGFGRGRRSALGCPDPSEKLGDYRFDLLMAKEYELGKPFVLPELDKALYTPYFKPTVIPDVFSEEYIRYRQEIDKTMGPYGVMSTFGERISEGVCPLPDEYLKLGAMNEVVNYVIDEHNFVCKRHQLRLVRNIKTNYSTMRYSTTYFMTLLLECTESKELKTFHAKVEVCSMGCKDLFMFKEVAHDWVFGQKSDTIDPATYSLMMQAAAHYKEKHDEIFRNGLLWMEVCGHDFYNTVSHCEHERIELCDSERRVMFKQPYHVFFELFKLLSESGEELGGDTEVLEFASESSERQSCSSGPMVSEWDSRIVTNRGGIYKWWHVKSPGGSSAWISHQEFHQRFHPNWGKQSTTNKKG